MGTKYEDNGRALGDNYCFACGFDNPYGLKLDFRIEGDRFVTETTLVREYQSYTGVAHGGIIGAGPLTCDKQSGERIRDFFTPDAKEQMQQLSYQLLPLYLRRIRLD